MKAFAAVVAVLALAASVSATVFTTGFSGVPLRTNYGFGYGRSFAPVSTFGVGYNNLGYNTLGYNTLGYNTLGYNSLGYNTLGFSNLGYNNFGYGYRPMTTFSTGAFSSPYSTFFKK